MPISKNDESIALYTVFRDNVYVPESVLYPASGRDASPACVFKRVRFVDIDREAIEDLRAVGLEGVHQDIGAYQGVHDLLILQNAGFPPALFAQNLVHGAFILANDYKSDASRLLTHPDFALWGSITLTDKRRGGMRVALARDLTHFFESVADEAELRHFRPAYAAFLEKLFRANATNNPRYDPKRPFAEQWAEHRTRLEQGMPAKRVADVYLFVKN